MKITKILNLFKSDLTPLPTKERELNLLNKRYLTKEKLKLMQKSIFKHKFIKKS